MDDLKVIDFEKENDFYLKAPGQENLLNIKFKDEDGKNKYLHMLNGTAIACSRAMIAIMENFQRAYGSIAIPPALIPYCGYSEIRR